jgi:hypothetical protein
MRAPRSPPFEPLIARAGFSFAGPHVPSERVRLLSTPTAHTLMLFAAVVLAVVSIEANALDDRLPAKFVGDWCLAEHIADHLTFYRRGGCANPDQDEWLTIRTDSFDVHEMHCKLLGARANRRGDYLTKFRCDDNLIQNYWFSLFNDRLYISETDREP